MKPFIGYLSSFTLMFAFTFAAIGALVLFFPLIMAFIAWDSSFIDFGWQASFTFIRINILVSVLLGLSFAFSKEGKQLVSEYTKNENAADR